MKIVRTILATLPFLGLVSGAFQGTNEEFINAIADGSVPEGLFAESLPSVRKLAAEPKGAGERCGNNNPCAEGLECTTSAFGRYCNPVTCVSDVIKKFIDRHDLHDYPERIMQRTGYYGVEVNNVTQAEKGWGGIGIAPQAWLNMDFKNTLVEAMEANPPNMTELLLDVLIACPSAATPTAATSAGITVMLGFHYECAFVLPKMFNNYYFAIGTSNLNLNVENTDNTTAGFELQYNATGGIFTDLCFGVGPDVGVDLGLTAGVLFSGTTEDLTDCSFMFDADIAVGTSFGLAIGVTSTTCVNKFMMTLGGGLGGGIGFTGCNTWQLSEIAFGS